MIVLPVSFTQGWQMVDNYMPTYANGYKQTVLKTGEPKGLWVRILPLAFGNHIAHDFQCEQLFCVVRKAAA